MDMGNSSEKGNQDNNASNDGAAIKMITWYKEKKGISLSAGK